MTLTQRSQHDILRDTLGLDRYLPHTSLCPKISPRSVLQRLVLYPIAATTFPSPFRILTALYGTGVNCRAAIAIAAIQ